MSTQTVKGEEHKRLAGIIKRVHASLRQKLQSKDADYTEIWENHCQDKEVLEEYAEAMHQLAVDHWNDRSESRIEWSYQTIIEYFFQDGLNKMLAKDLRRQCSENKKKASMNKDDTDEMKNNSSKLIVNSPSSNSCSNYSEEQPPILEHHSSLASTSSLSGTCYTYTTISIPSDHKIRLLDVGSCYNPFNIFGNFQTVGIDICPAIPSVYQCDFLNLKTIEPLSSECVGTYIDTLQNPIVTLPKELFHVCVFSLLLEYLPSPHQRLTCCKKACELLVMNGLLLIITPDSHSQHRNAAMIKSWKLAVESLGFKRWKYLKKEHLHCLAFRKVNNLSDTMCVEIQDLMYIPQDCNSVDTLEEVNKTKSLHVEDGDIVQSLLNELPNLDLSDVE